ncbi:fibrinogen C domain-containing protein 1-like [Mytilus trossulus]|uniref:fibrinogen C domain-containing protein 1-like n=1 Tax=Mytilus trossulus TaxID=6551 RepID=UPI0030049E78
MAGKETRHYGRDTVNAHSNTYKQTFPKRTLTSSLENEAFKAANSMVVKSTQETLYSCATVCANEENCCSASFKTESQQCDLFRSCCTSEDQLLEIEGVHVVNKTPMPVDCSSLPPDSCSGVYTIQTETGMKIDVFCEMEIDNGGWTVIQRRFDGSTDFYRNWDDYRIGFGLVAGEHWLGNNYIHAITRQRSYKVRFDLEDFEGRTKYAIYTVFSINNEGTNYTLSIEGFSGTAGDSMKLDDGISNNGMMFSTRDRENDLLEGKDCAARKGGAWWYNHCTGANINGIYGRNAAERSSVHWKEWLGETPLKKTIMMIKPNF